jgi:hypothetical protein
MVLFQWPSWSALLCRPCRIYIKRAREAEEEEKEEDRQPSASAKVCLPRVLFFARWPSKTSPPVCHPIILNMITNLEACGRNTTSYKDSYMNTSYLFYQCNIIMTYKDIYIWLPSFHVAFLAWSRPSFHGIFRHETCYNLIPHVFGWLIYIYIIYV